MEYIGFDYHKQYSFATSINKETGEVRIARLSNTPAAIEDFIQNPEESIAVLEASRTWPVLYNLLKDCTKRVVLAHPSRVKAIASAKIKTDKIDSKILAELLSADLIPESHIRNDENRSVQIILRQRVFFVSARTRVKNRIHYIVDKQTYEVRSTIEGLTDLFGKAGMEWLRLTKELSNEDRLLLDQLLSLLDLLNSLVAQSDKLVKTLLKNDQNAQLLLTIPGVGPFFAVLISTEIDGIERFPSADKLASYIGLVPSTYASGGMVRHGKITKQGNKWLRWAFVEAAQTAKRCNAQLNKFCFKKMKKHGKAKATVALARRLVTITYSMLKNKRKFEVYKEPNYVKKAS